LAKFNEFVSSRKKSILSSVPQEFLRFPWLPVWHIRCGQEATRKITLLMHAMGPNVAGSIGTAIAAGMFISVLK
jgi:hypothetical protein